MKPSISGFVLTSLSSAVGIENGRENMLSQAGHNSHDTALVRRPKSRRISAGPGHDHCRGPEAVGHSPEKATMSSAVPAFSEPANTKTLMINCRFPIAPMNYL